MHTEPGTPSPRRRAPRPRCSRAHRAGHAITSPSSTTTAVQPCTPSRARHHLAVEHHDRGSAVDTELRCESGHAITSPRNAVPRPRPGTRRRPAQAREVAVHACEAERFRGPLFSRTLPSLGCVPGRMSEAVQRTIGLAGSTNAWVASTATLATAGILAGRTGRMVVLGRRARAGGPRSVRKVRRAEPAQGRRDRGGPGRADDARAGQPAENRRFREYGACSSRRRRHESPHRRPRHPRAGPRSRLGWRSGPRRPRRSRSRPAPRPNRPRPSCRHRLSSRHRFQHRHRPSYRRQLRRPPPQLSRSWSTRTARRRAPPVRRRSTGANPATRRSWIAMVTALPVSAATPDGCPRSTVPASD